MARLGSAWLASNLLNPEASLRTPDPFPSVSLECHDSGHEHSSEKGAGAGVEMVPVSGAIQRSQSWTGLYHIFGSHDLIRILVPGGESQAQLRRTGKTEPFAGRHRGKARHMVSPANTAVGVNEVGQKWWLTPAPRCSRKEIIAVGSNRWHQRRGNRLANPQGSEKK